MSETRPVWLVGMMGAGKSTLGPVIAARLRREFVDSDQEVERTAGRTVAEIFESEGEAGFRARERGAVQALEGTGAVVALGGGAFSEPGLRQWLLESGAVVYLAASPEALAERVGDAENRPLLRGRTPEERVARIRELLSERESAYRQAHLTLDTEVWDANELARQLEEGLLRMTAEMERGE